MAAYADERQADVTIRDEVTALVLTAQTAAAADWMIRNFDPDLYQDEESVAVSFRSAGEIIQAMTEAGLEVVREAR
jgi:hypothetical protein